jgi:hypothetical protein
MNMMSYKTMLEDAKSTGKFDEKKMWDSVADFEEVLCSVKESDPQVYYKFMRNAYGVLHGGHYGEEFALWDVSQMHSEQPDHKEEFKGEYWSVKDVKEATKDMQFASGVTDWDKYVAFNATKHDFGIKYADADILKLGYLFYFADKDYAGATKVWDYMKMVHQHNAK